jgi:protein-S-isoprenylcysteine O-methyltransferase Ste14
MSPNLKPKTFKERLLWVSWTLIILGWTGQPLLAGRHPDSILFSFIPGFFHDSVVLPGIFFLLSGYAGTLWCYVILGDSWRIGVNTKEKTTLVQNGPYRFIRHPIYLFQMIILTGVACLLPTLFSIFLLVLHIVSAAIKATDEEAYLIRTHGDAYKSYYAGTGRFLPKIFRWK